MSSSSSKRKNKEDGQKVSLEYARSDVDAGVEGPFLAVFPGITPPKDTPFNVYKPDTEETKSKKKRRIIEADTGKVEFVGQNFGESARQGFCRYVIAIRDKNTDKVIFKDAPVIAVDRTIKSLKNAKVHTSSREQFMQAKNTLGEAFGTKKIKQQIKSVERNAVNVSTLESVASILTDSIAAKTSALPSKAEIKAKADEDRPIPPYDINATKVEDIYKLDTLITPAEYQIIPFKALLDKTNKPLEILPFPGSTYVNDGLTAALAVSKKDRHRIRLLMYINFLMAFSTIPDRRLDDSETVNRIMGDAPSLILENFYERFTESPQGTDKKRHTFTPKSKDKLLCWILAIALTLENFNMDASLITRDLSLKQTKVNELFKAMGCKINELTATQKAQMNVSVEDAKMKKRAVLTWTQGEKTKHVPVMTTKKDPSATKKPLNTLSSIVSNLVRAAIGGGTGKHDHVSDQDLDEYVADMIMKSAAESRAKYDKFGLGSGPKASPAKTDSVDKIQLPSGVIIDRAESNGLKTNKRFLSSIIKHTDEHNQALIRSEEKRASEIAKALIADLDRKAADRGEDRDSRGRRRKPNTERMYRAKDWRDSSPKSSSGRMRMDELEIGDLDDKESLSRHMEENTAISITVKIQIQDQVTVTVSIKLKVAISVESIPIKFKIKVTKGEVEE
ncbi:DNA-directed RNA polymerase I subunit rpa49 [Gryganskiella cystojenkinii]|nr:DNA-directed RNA polymerase I subunit rpa49 [Gryganskiella cystojenkinii]